MTTSPSAPSNVPEALDEMPRVEDRSGDWAALRQQVVAALDEDPVNEASLVRHMDRGVSLSPAQRVVAVLAGFSTDAQQAAGLLDQALSLRQSRLSRGEAAAPLRLALFEVLLQENRRRTDPLLAELRLAPAPDTGGMADPARGATATPVLVGELQSELRRARRFKQPASVLLVHLDPLADLLEQSGRAAAERLISDTVLLINNEIRDVDWSVRTSADDLCVFLSGTGRFGAWLVARRVAAKLARVAAPPGGGPTLRASIGIAAFPQDARFGPELMTEAGRAMFQARAEGGGAICDPSAPDRWRLTQVHSSHVRVIVRESRDVELPLPVLDEGLAFDSPVPYEVGQSVELECIEVSGTGRAAVSGRVVKVEQIQEGAAPAYRVGVACHLDQDAEVMVRRGAPTEPA